MEEQEGGGLNVSETVLGVAGVTGVCFGVGFLPLVTGFSDLVLVL